MGKRRKDLKTGIRLLGENKKRDNTELQSLNSKELCQFQLAK